ncbi:hypothetical protein D1AOALGA4SA_1655 [Olavius algarvensis Delta 1 endosymbiont]|nr:hypothetical protein D1AOALGA4SA_1655 [Olavius algarvensis Delta 1 endosymbiont]
MSIDECRIKEVASLHLFFRMFQCDLGAVFTAELAENAEMIFFCICR